MLKYTPKECQEILDKNKKLDWYHKFEVELGSGIETPGRLDVKGYEWRRNFLNLNPETLKGKRVLDIGAYSGAFSFLLEDLGAEVVAADVYDPARNGFSLVQDMRGSKVKHERISVYDLDPEQIGLFDIVAFYGVHYHLKHPMLAYERCNSVCKPGGMFVGGGTGMDRWFHDPLDETCQSGVNFDRLTNESVNNKLALSADAVNDLPLMGFSNHQFLKDKTNWFIPNLTGLLAWVESSGFEVTGSHKNALPLTRDWNTNKAIFRTSLNFKAIKVAEPRLEYTYEPMQQFEIPTVYQLNKLKAQVKDLEAQLAKK